MLHLKKRPHTSSKEIKETCVHLFYFQGRKSNDIVKKIVSAQTEKKYAKNVHITMPYYFLEATGGFEKKKIIICVHIFFYSCVVLSSLVLCYVFCKWRYIIL